MKNDIIHFDLDNEMDIIMAHKRAVQVGELTGLSASDQTRFATAVSEISRNCLEFAKKGSIKFSIEGAKDNLHLLATIEDHGPGIRNLDEILSRQNIDMRNRGAGIVNSRKLVSTFVIDTCDTGTCVTLGKKIPQKHPPINPTIITGWRKHFQKESVVSPYEEIKNRNGQLLAMADELKSKKLEADLQVEEIRKLNGILEKKNENLKQIAYSFAHDLKNPINSIKLSGELLLLPGKTLDRARFVEMLQKNLNRLLAILDGLQQTINEDPDIALSADEVDLHSVVEDLHEQFDPYLLQIGGQMTFDFGKVKEIRYPRVYLYSILSNMISNSIKYASDEPLVIQITGRKSDKSLFELEVKDNGIGIDLKRYGNRMFKPLNRFTAQGEGTGLGLSIVRHFITKNGGDIMVESTPGKGTMFTCYLKEYMK